MKRGLARGLRSEQAAVRAGWLAALLVLSALASPAGAAVSLFDDFSSQTQNNYGLTRSTDGSGSLLISFITPATTPKSRGNHDNSLQIFYDISGVVTNVYFIDTVSLTSANLSGYQYISFWVRGASGGEGFQVGLGNSAPFFESKVYVNDWLPQGITTQWQKVVIPIKVLANSDSNSFNPATINKFVIVMNKTTQFGALTGTVYIDDITFGSAVTDVWIDNHNKGGVPAATNACGGPDFGWGTNFTASYVAVTYSPQAPYIWKCDYSSGSGSGGFTHALPTNAGGQDFSGCTTLEFDILGGPGGSQTPALRMRSNTVDYAYWLGFYFPATTTARISDIFFKHATIPLSNLTSVANLNAVSEITLDQDASPQSLYYVDNMIVTNRNLPLTPATPSLMTYDGDTVFTGYAIYDNGSVSVTASSFGGDPKMEGVKFDYSGDNGATWTTIGNDYSLSDGKTNYGAYWDVSGLALGAYILRATVFHANGSLSTPPLQYNVNRTLGTPTFTPTVTATPTFTPTPTISATMTPSPTASPTSTTSPTPSITPTFTPTATITPTSTITPTVTITSTVLPGGEGAQVLIGRNSFNPAKGEVLPVAVALTSRGPLKITIFARRGTKIRELANQDAGPGIVYLNWDGKDSGGQTVASGIYIIYVDGPDQRVKKLVAVVK
jgi:hypothetical protein